MTIAQQLKVKDFPFTIKDKQGKEIYWEDSDGYILNNRPKKEVELGIEDIFTKSFIDNYIKNIK